jgi:hypothetical protein
MSCAEESLMLLSEKGLGLSEASIGDWDGDLVFEDEESKHGHGERSSDWLVLGRGYLKLLELAQGFLIARRCDQS